MAQTQEELEKNIEEKTEEKVERREKKKKPKMKVSGKGVFHLKKLINPSPTRRGRRV